MPDAAHDVQQEYWRPPAQPRVVEPASGPRGQLACPQCGAEFVVGSRFCHICGSERQQPGALARRWVQVLDFSRIRESLGLSVGSLIAFFAGMACVIAAIATGLIYTASTLTDWQAVQVWRMEWLLAAAVALLAGILLKKPEAR